VADFLLELRSEEIPARMQAGARAMLENLFLAETSSRGLHIGAPEDQHAAVSIWSTPRRLALLARGLPLATDTVSEEIKGPKVGAPPQALEGFLRKTGLRQDQLIERGGVYFAITEKPGRATADVLAEAIPAIIRAFSWPKSMRWGAASLSTESLRWVRPLSGIVALLDDVIVECKVGSIVSGRTTLGHRFHSHDEIRVETPDAYVQQMRAHHVVVDHAEREALIRRRAAEVAHEAGLVLVEDEGLVIENAGLTEWPVPLVGRFDAAFLEVPPEVIQLTARTNQKYFICRNQAGKLANAFICTANIVAADGGLAIVAGNRKVLAARLSDARFFWEQDRRHTLAEQAKKLDRITFHEKLGTVADKVERIAKLARWLVEEGIVGPAPLPLAGGAGGGALPSIELAASQDGESDAHPNPSRKREGLDRAALADLAEQAARLCKADLVTEMVGEFPELQGVMGGYYARAEGLPDEVADAIRDHYKPVGQGDEVPTAPVTVAVSLADKLDTLGGFFGRGMPPTGSKDPFALRRAMLGVIATIISNRLRVSYRKLFYEGLDGYQAPFLDSSRDIFFDFAIDRLKVQQREAGVRHDLIDAVFALGGEDDLVRLLARVRALQSFVATEDGSNLLAGYKRAANILKKEGFTAPLPLAGGAGGGHSDLTGQGEPSQLEVPPPNPSRKREGDYVPAPAEAALIAALAAATPSAEAAIAAEDFAAAMTALASLRTPIDAFFEQVTVNDADPQIRAARLGLLDQFRAAVHKVADFSRIEG
jgi:glycyl-tRNA synthetase beta chain